MWPRCPFLSDSVFSFLQHREGRSMSLRPPRRDTPYTACRQLGRGCTLFTARRRCGKTLDTLDKERVLVSGPGGGRRSARSSLQTGPRRGRREACSHAYRGRGACPGGPPKWYLHTVGYHVTLVTAAVKPECGSLATLLVQVGFEPHATRTYLASYSFI